ncbi:hypothetical protein [Cohnella sp. WQ 127256]|uniref:hypothetical protein n=1 Tax=Cohnella sp. WQ 127256 TaxID=2938790 RepID=UPI002117D6CD|nr:hypothetical protein [Cohnella sp. WQ 127256]
MTQGQAVRHIGAYMWKRERLGIFFTLLFALYIASVISFSINGVWAQDGEPFPRFFYIVIDSMYLIMFPVFGLVMNKSAMGMWKGDSYSKRLAQWRVMPVPLKAIVQARFLQSAITLPIIGTLFLLLQYLLAPNLREMVSPLQWVESGIIWGCYAFAINIVFAWCELGFDGKRYVQFYLGFMIFMTIVSILLVWQGVFLFQGVLEIIKEGHGVFLIIGLMIVAAIVTWMGFRATISRIRARSMTL